MTLLVVQQQCGLITRGTLVLGKQAPDRWESRYD
jgi:hypothetical protein